MRLLIRADDIKSFSQALTIASQQGRDIVEVPEMRLFSVDGLSDQTVARLRDIGPEVHVRPEEVYSPDV